MKLVAFNKNGKSYEVKKAYFDGYSVGDRLLEGVIFEITIVKGKIKARAVPGIDANYFADLNEKKWIKDIEDAITSDSFISGAGLCINPNMHGDEVYLRV